MIEFEKQFKSLERTNDSEVGKVRNIYNDKNTLRKLDPNRGSPVEKGRFSPQTQSYQNPRTITETENAIKYVINNKNAQVSAK